MKLEDIKSRRTGQPRKSPNGFWSFIPNALPPDLEFTPGLIRLLADAERQLGELAGIGRATGIGRILPNPYLLIQPAIHKEAVLSSRIEGTQSGLDDLFFFEAAPDDAPGRSDVREVHNYVLAMEYGLQRLATLPVSLRLMRELHEKLMTGVGSGQGNPGEFRWTQNWIGPPGCTLSEATYVPPPVEEMNACLDHLEKYLNGTSELPDLIRIALMHSQFEMIHPFTDGNGRVGRLLISLLMVHWGKLPYPLLYLSSFFERYRSEYYRHLLAVSMEGKWEGWVEFFLRGVREQSQEACRAGTRLIEMQVDYRNKLMDKRVSKICFQVIDHLFANPVVTAPFIRDKWKVNFRTAQKTLDDLSGVGILNEVTGQRRNRTWVASGILAALNERG